MTSTDRDTETGASSAHPVLLAFDGTELAAHAVAEAGAQLAATPRAADGSHRVAALVLCVWQPADVGFIPVSKRHFDAASADEVRTAAEGTAAYGAALAEKAGFHAQSLALQAAPIWRGIIEVADEHEVSLIVLGSRRHSGLTGHLLGSVAASASAHSRYPVLLVPQAVRGV